jgi:hypothetical protein
MVILFSVPSHGPTKWASIPACSGIDHDLLSPIATGATAGQYYGTSLAIVQDPAVID